MKYRVEVVDNRVWIVEVEAENPAHAKQVVEESPLDDLDKEQHPDLCEWYVACIHCPNGETIHADDV